MDLKDMILVTENDRGTETNMLMTLDDYKSFIAVDDMSELMTCQGLQTICCSLEEHLVKQITSQSITGQQM